MGYLLKEALKTLCGINQWSYGVFWKFGCQNPKLLIWEECYYEPASEIPYQDHNASTETVTLRSGVSGGNKLPLLVDKMMTEYHVNIVGEGLVGRVAFNGNHQWIISENYYRETHPPEVLKEICLQFSAGIMTVVVVPVLPYGVAQFGSYSTITENIEFVDRVVSLVHELGCVPGVLQSTNQDANELAPKIGFPVYPGFSTPQELPLDSYMIDASFVDDSLNYVGCSAQTSEFDSHVPLLASNSSSYHLNPYDCHDETKPLQANELAFSFPSHFMYGMSKAEVIPSNSIAWTDEYSPLNSSRSIENFSFCSSSITTHASIRCTERRILSDNVNEGHCIKPKFTGIQISDVKSNSGLISSCNEVHQGISSNIKPFPGTTSETVTSIRSTSSGLKNMSLSKMEMSFADSGDHPETNSVLASCSGANELHTNKKFAQNELSHWEEEMKQNDLTRGNALFENAVQLKLDELIPGCVGDDSINDNTCFESQSGDDLFDILGADFKDKWLSNCWRSYSSDRLAKIMPNSDTNDSTSKIHGISSVTGTNHLLDAVVSKIHPSMKHSLDSTVSCITILNSASCSSAPTSSLPYGKFAVSENMQGDLSGMPKNTAKARMMCSSSLSTASLKEDSGIYSQGSSIYDPWIERGHNTRQSKSASTRFSTKPHETSKTNRKRLKPGESSRPRPKDRQMIQERVKELREIVPNGAKCSIDALLERTIKHMLFLESVTKHADKLKQAAESKIVSKDGGLLLKDNLGGATWAYEVGSQSMVCPIIIEDLNQPHQMLVEMLCEESGLFLEIADIIRGLGLTILKGLMETRNDKIWAHFAVEANRNVTRMEIFLSLVRLLEQNAKSGVPQANSTNNTTVQEVHQAALASASGGLYDSIFRNHRKKIRDEG